MTVRILERGKSRCIPIPDGLAVRLLIHQLRLRGRSQNILPENMAGRLCRELLRVKGKYENWMLVEVEHSDGKTVQIVL